MVLEEAVKLILAVVQEAYNEEGIESVLNETTPLVGSESVLDSMALVQVCLSLEDKAEEIGFHFDWTSEAAMSKSKGMYRTIVALAEEFHNQYKRGT
jgi:hypothetical protein